MAYSKTIWQNGASPALDAEHLNNIEDGIEAIDIRVTTNEDNITTNSTNITDAIADIATNTTSIETINTTLTDAVVVKQGTFSGVTSPTLSTTFNISNYTDYNWTVNVYQTNRVTSNGHLVLLNGYLDVDGNTLQLVSTDDGAAVAARYTLVGFKKSISSLATLNI